MSYDQLKVEGQGKMRLRASEARMQKISYLILDYDYLVVGGLVDCVRCCIIIITIICQLELDWLVNGAGY